MIQVRAMSSQDQLKPLKQRYVRQATAPLDGMWLSGFVPMAKHFGFYEGDELVGFFCVNDQGYLLQFLLNQDRQNQASQLFETVLCGNNLPSGNIRGAFVSTAEPYFLSLCLDCFSKFDVNALMYQRDGGIREKSSEGTLSMPKVVSAQLSEAVDFAVASIGAPEDWLAGYYTNLINRQELFGVWENGRLIATGESRGYDELQTEYADVGVIVAKSERCKGLATRILKQLVTMNEANSLKSICSTEKTNIAAQKAIGRAGFFAKNRIIQFHAEPT